MPTSQALCEAYMAWKDNAKTKQKSSYEKGSNRNTGCENSNTEIKNLINGINNKNELNWSRDK